MKVYDVLPGSKLVECGAEVILLGVPPEVVKAITSQKLPIPTAILIPDCLLIGTNFQNATEFPLYYFLFFAKGLQTGRKFKVIGHEPILKNNQQLLRLSLLGPSIEEMKTLGIHASIAQMLRREADYFGLKDPQGNLLQVDSFIENYCFDEDGCVECSGIKIRRISFNRYEITAPDGESLDVTLATDVEQSPPYTVLPSFESNQLYKFGVKILGGSNGFSSSNPCSGLMCMYNGMCILIDCIPYLDYQLQARGISKSEISALFLSHIHDDHCNLLPLMLSNFKIKIITTKEIYWMAMAKLSLMMNVSIREVMSYFDFVPITVGKTLDFYGLQIDAHYAVHSIPTIGVRFSIHTFQRDYTIQMTSDNQSLDDIDRMCQEDGMSLERRDFIHKVYTDKVDILFADGGEGMLHGRPKDALGSQAERVVFFHIDKLSGDFNTTFSLASSGKNYVVVKGNTNFYITRAVEILLRYFHGIDMQWISVFMDSFEVINYNADDVIIHEGADSSNKIYIIVTGYCRVVKHIDGKLVVIARKEGGDIFGEMAVLTGKRKRNASVIASSPVTACICPEEVFYSLALRNEIKKTLLDQWAVHLSLERIPFFARFHHQILKKLVSHGTVRVFKDTEIYDVAEFFYVVLEGMVYVQEGSEALEAGDFFGFYGFNERKQYAVRVEAEAKLLIFRYDVIARILYETPSFLFYLRFCKHESMDVFPLE